MLRFIVLAGAFAWGSAHAQQEIRFWHAMSGTRAHALETFVQRFNAAQSAAWVAAEHKGPYEATMAAALAAQRAGNGPHIVQVFEVGTADMLAARGSIRPLWQVLAEAGERVDAKSYLPAVAGVFADGAGRLVALPFNVSTPILLYNRDAFRKAGLDPERPPRTWYEMPDAIAQLKEAGFECALTTAWQSWVHLENMSTWHNQEFATRDNGLAGLDARLVFNTHLMVRHVSLLSSWVRSGYFTYSGRRDEGEARFMRGECAMITSSSSRYGDLRRAAAFDFGAAELPHYDDIRGAPHHTLIGGAGLWVLAGKGGAEYRAAASFLAWLARPEIQAEWHQRTGYVPTTRAAYELTRRQGFYAAHPEQEIAVRQLSRNNPTRESRGIRLGDFLRIRAILDEELEAVWEGRKPPKLALDDAAARGNEVLRRFEQAHRAGAKPAAPARAAPRARKQ